MYDNKKIFYHVLFSTKMIIRDNAPNELQILKQVAQRATIVHMRAK